MNRTVSALAGGLCLTVAASSAAVAWRAMETLRGATAALRAAESAIRTHERVTAQMPDLARSISTSWSADARRAIGREGDLTRRSLAEAIEVADRRISSVQDDARRGVDAVNASAAELAKVRGDLKPVLDRAAALTERIDTAVAPHLDCRSNGNCWPAGVTASLGGFKMLMGEGAQAARRVDGALPRFISMSEQMVAQSRDVASNLNRLTRPRWYDRLLGYGLNGVVLYRNLNPAANFTLRGTQLIAPASAVRP